MNPKVPSSPPGWYPLRGQLRYWDGHKWTDHVAPVTTPDPHARSATGSAGAATGRIGAAGLFGWVGLVLLVLTGLLGSGASGAFGSLATFALVVGVVVLVRGRVGWAHLHTRASSVVALAVAVAGFTISGLTAPHQMTTVVHHQVAASKVPGPTPHVTRAGAPRSVKKAHTRRSPPIRKPRHVRVGVVVTAAGAVLPNHDRTPGAVNPAVTQATIGRTICVAGWTSTVRPSSSVTTRLKIAELASGYSYKGETATGVYEEDHLIPLELGGAPSDPRNLWPEPYNSPEGARVKDLVENRLHALVCSHVIGLAVAQKAISINWWSAYKTYGGNAYSAPSHTTPTPKPAPKPAPQPVTPGNGATAQCNDGTYSYAAHHQGACSHHNGVRIFYK